jgi:outer membrane lipoprotein-sorting protein
VIVQHLLLLLLALPLAAADPVTAALERFTAVKTYQVTLRSTSGGEREIIRYYYKKPGFIRMEFKSPHRGAVLVYDPKKKKVRIRPFGMMEPFVLTLDPDNRLVRSSQGHCVDESDLGALLRRVLMLKEKGTAVTDGKEILKGRAAMRVVITGREGMAVDGIHRYRLWLDAASRLPLKVVAYAASGEVLEEVLMDDLAVDVPLPERLFEL